MIGLALLPAFGNLAGGLAAEFTRTPIRRLNKALHEASGNLGSRFPGIDAGGVAGALRLESWNRVLGRRIAYVLIQAAVDRAAGSESDASAANRGIRMIYIAASVDLFSDGLLIGAGSAVAMWMAVVMARGQVLAVVFTFVSAGLGSMSTG